MKKEQQELQAPELTPPRRAADDSNKEKLDKTIRISSRNYERLAKLGDISWDFNDALNLVLDHWEKTKGKKDPSMEKKI
jgi:hypothetical protein